MNWPGSGLGNGAGNGGAGEGPAVAFVPDEQLRLTGDDDTLPWLASDDDDEEPEGGTDYRLLVFAAAALLALGGILWAANSFLADNDDGGLVADGSTIEAPEGDYKQRPANPGGQDVAGTGDLSYEVGEGISREGQIGGSEPLPAPTAEPAQSGTPATTASGAAPAPATGGVGVQVGAFQTRASAEAGWTQLTSRHEVLQGVGHRIIEGRADSGTIFRLQAVAADVAAAETLCSAIRNGGGDCQVKR